MKKLSSVLSEKLVNSKISLVNLDSFEELLKHANEINDDGNKTIIKPVLHQQHIKPIDQDEILLKYFEISDIIDCFHKVSGYYTDERKKLSWMDEKLIREFVSIKKYINQLASYISIDHKSVEVEVSVPPDTFDNQKALSTFIKQSDEWKRLKALLKSDLTLSNQSLTIRCLGVSIVNKVKSFVKILN